QLEILPFTEFADHRGRILTFLPPEALVEYNLITTKAGTIRGEHWHPHFIEYLLFAAGTGSLIWRDIDSDERHVVPIRPGLSTRAVPGVAHAVHAETDVVQIALL